MDRRNFVAGSLGIATALALPRISRAGRATASSADLPDLALTLTDAGFEIAQPLAAGRYRVTVANTGTLAESHFALGKIPDRVSDAQYQEWFCLDVSRENAAGEYPVVMFDAKDNALDQQFYEDFGQMLEEVMGFVADNLEQPLD